MTTLRFLGLIDEAGTPLTRLKALVSARGPQHAESLKQIANSAYDFLSSRTFDPQIATYAQLEDAFHNTYQVSGDVARKCIKFFTSLESDAGIPLSHFIMKKSKTSHTNSAGRKRSTAKTDGRTKQNLQIPAGIQEIPSKNPWYEMVLAKFPTFDPAWSDEVKLKWFDAFDTLLKKPGT